MIEEEDTGEDGVSKENVMVPDPNCALVALESFQPLESR